MNRSAKKARFAELPEQNLPGAPLSSERSASLKAPVPNRAIGEEFRISETNSLSGGLADLLVKAGQDTTTAKDLSQVRSASHERLFHLVETQAQLARENKMERVSVVLRPDEQTEIVLRLRVQDGQVQAHARCERGDFANLNSGWTDLQRSLLECGVKLDALSSGGVEMTGDHTSRGSDSFGSASSFAQQRQSQHAAETFGRETAGAPRPGSASSAPRPAQASERLLEKWA
jgi:hypothetical protein